RHIRVRPGPFSQGGQGDGITVYIGGGIFPHDVIIDHCDIMYATDENFDITSARNGTLQWSLVALPATTSSDGEDTAPGYATLIGNSSPTWTQPEHFGITVHHNAFVHAVGRNPAIGLYPNPGAGPL